MTGLSPVPAWAVHIVESAAPHWRLDDDLLVQQGAVDAPGLSFYEAIGGVAQHDWSADPGTASHYDVPRYRALVERAVALGGRRLAADLGCGDGRITRMLLQSAVENVISVDFFPGSIERLARSLGDTERSRVLAALGAVEAPPIAPGRCDVVTCVEVLCTLPDRTAALLRIGEWLKPGGAALIVEPAVEGSATYAMLAGDDEQIEKVLARKRRDDRIRDNALEVTLSTRDSLRSEIVQAGLSVAHEESLPSGAALLIAHLRRRGAVEPSTYQLISTANELSSMPPRMHAVIAVKAADDATELDSQ